jgi:hypothetical protein
VLKKSWSAWSARTMAEVGLDPGEKGASVISAAARLLCAKSLRCQPQRQHKRLNRRLALRRQSAFAALSITVGSLDHRKFGKSVDRHNLDFKEIVPRNCFIRQCLDLIDLVGIDDRKKAGLIAGNKEEVLELILAKEIPC